ncbi:MAG: DoxX family membrane protein [Acidobacteriota bacterium]
MSMEAWGMLCAGVAALVAGLVLVRPRFGAVAGAGKLVVLGPVFEAVALAMFSAEHFTAAHDLAPAVPRWLPWHLFWVYFFGTALLAAAISLILWIGVRWSAALLTSFYLVIVLTLDVPGIPALPHDRFFWILTVRETSFAGGVMVLAASVWARPLFERLGRCIVALVMIFYAVEHFLHPHHVPGVPLEKLIPAWWPAPALLAYAIGIALLVCGIGLLFPRFARLASASCGLVLVLLTALFYVPIFISEMRTPLAVEGLNYIGDTLLFAATVLLAGFGADLVSVRKPARLPVAAMHA